MPRLTLLLACCAAAAGIGTPAHAAGGTVVANYTVVLRPFGTAYLAVAECSATALPGTQPDVPLATSVACDVNGGGSANPESSNLVPGARAETVFQGIASPSMFLCISGEATFFQTLPAAIYTVTLPERCDAVGP